MQNLTIEIVEKVAHQLAIKIMTWDEPIPEFKTRFSKILESCLNAPFQKFAKKDLYRGLVDKAAILFYLMIKNHPFQNGNKRVAVTTLFVFLFLNKKWLKVDGTVLYNLAVWVAGSQAELKEEVVLAIEKFIKIYLVNY